MNISCRVLPRSFSLYRGQDLFDSMTSCARCSVLCCNRALIPFTYVSAARVQRIKTLLNWNNFCFRILCLTCHFRADPRQCCNNTQITFRSACDNHPAGTMLSRLEFTFDVRIQCKGWSASRHVNYDCSTIFLSRHMRSSSPCVSPARSSQPF